MEAYATEEQQLEAIKKWFKKYGNTLFWTLIAILAVVGGIRYWYHHQDVLHNQASEDYLLLMTALEQKDETTIKNKADALLKNFPSSAYATFGAFVLASQAVKSNDFPQAKSHLQWVIDHGPQSNLKALATVRLMRLLVTEDKLDEAMALYDPKIEPGYLPMMEELKGDILVKQHQPVLAREAYEKAIKDAPQEGMYGPLLKLKLEDLGIDPQTILTQEKTAKKEAKQ